MTEKTSSSGPAAATSCNDKVGAGGTAKHTPGPWWADAWYGINKEGNELATVRETFPADEGVANALLIAAAPDLLDALKALIRAGHLLNSSSNEWNAVHAAIDKAEGRA